MTTLRILCLHDNHSNALQLKNEFHLLGKQLYEQHNIDFVYVNGPIIESNLPSTSPIATTQQQNNFIWYEKKNSNNDQLEDCVLRPNETIHRSDINNTNVVDSVMESTTSLADVQQQPLTSTTDIDTEDPFEPQQRQQPQPQQYIGLDASLMLLRQIWTSSGTFWGILGVGTGAAIASLFVTVLESETLAYNRNLHHQSCDASEIDGLCAPLPPSLPQMIVLISGETLLSVDEPLLVSDYYNNSSNNTNNSRFILHLVDTNTTNDQELLIRQFPQGSQIEQRKQQRDRQQLSHHDLNVIGRFICQRKKDLYLSQGNDDGDDESMHSNNNTRILALQTALYNAEYDASNCIAETIALNPPSALMAVIRPQMVAGWKGNRRPQPAGGGAPCPIEFLHRTDHNKRS